MLQDLDQSIKQLLVSKVPINLSEIDISFEMPTSKWSAAVTRPTINCYLYDIRENRELRSNERYLTRTAHSGEETRAPARVDFTYLLSAWTSDIADEHQLLGSLLCTLLRYPVLPVDILKGTLITQPVLPHAWIAFGDRTPNAWDFWGGLDGQMKAGISYVVTLAVTTSDSVSVGLVTQKVINISDAEKINNQE